MPLIKKKISEFPLADSLKGLYTIGYKIIDGIKTSVKVSLEDIQTAYQDVVNAIKKSEEATSNANNAAVTAEEKATAANVAAQEAEKIANNPTYIGKDHYVYVYNKDTGSFDKTDIYCKGEPGSSFRVAGEYATLEALKSAVPDGSAVDGFMAVGTEAPYDYYAWVNGEWVSQGKIGGIDEAPTDGKAYGRKNGNWAEVPEKSDVLTKTNTSSFTPTGDYQPATKKYVDDKVYIVNNSTWKEVLYNNKSVNGTDVQALINKLFGTYSAYLSFLQGVNENVYNSLKFTDWMYDDVNEYSVGSSCIAGNLYAKHNTAEGGYNCNFTYFYNNTLKSCIINVDEASNHNYDKLIIQDLVQSDNLTTLTKKTAAEYDAIGSKDANTAYCVTD